MWNESQLLQEVKHLPFSSTCVVLSFEEVTNKTIFATIKNISFFFPWKYEILIIWFGSRSVAL